MSISQAFLLDSKSKSVCLTYIVISKYRKRADLFIHHYCMISVDISLGIPLAL